MKRLVAIQDQRRLFLHHKIVIWGLVLISIFLISSCKSPGEPSDEQIENAKTTVMAIRDTLFVPVDSTLLAERLTYGTNPELMPGCVRAFILMAYQTPHSFQQILAEYREGLKTTGWEPSPYHSHDQDDFDIFIAGTQEFFEISSYPLREDILPVPTLKSSAEQSLSIYYLQLSHYDPAIKGCSG